MVHVDFELGGVVCASVPIDALCGGGTVLLGGTGRGICSNDEALHQVFDPRRFRRLHRPPNLRRHALEDDVDGTLQHFALHDLAP